MVLEALTGTAPRLDPHRCAGSVATACGGGGISAAGRDSSVEHARISTDRKAKMLYHGQPLEGLHIPELVQGLVLLIAGYGTAENVSQSISKEFVYDDRQAANADEAHCRSFSSLLVSALLVAGCRDAVGPTT